MVVKLIQSDSLEILEKEINEYLEKTARQVTFRHGNGILPSVDIKVVPGFAYKQMDYKNGNLDDEYMNPYFIAVIQY